MRIVQDILIVLEVATTLKRVFQIPIKDYPDKRFVDTPITIATSGARIGYDSFHIILPSFSKTVHWPLNFDPQGLA
jgi:hypothetical protein